MKLRILLLSTLLFIVPGCLDKVAEEVLKDITVLDLELSHGYLTPAFTPLGTNYTVYVQNRVSSIELAPKTLAFAVITVNGNAPRTSYDLDLGNNSFQIRIMSVDGSFQRNISVEVVRARQFVYVSNVDTNHPNDTVSAYSIHPDTGVLEPIEQFNVGNDPYDLLVAPSGQALYVANSQSDTISQFNIDAGTGELSPMSPAAVTTGPEPYAMTMSSDSRHFYIPMGDSSGPGNLYQYLSGAGVLSPMSTPTVNSGNHPWFCDITPDNRFVYATNFNGFSDPNNDTIEMYSRDASSGFLTRMTPNTVLTGDKPWHINVHPSGDFVYNTNYGSNTVSAYSINNSTGQLTELGSSPFTVESNPIGLVISPNGQFLYVANTASGTISQFTIQANGTLVPMSTPTVSIPSPYGLEIESHGNYLYAASSGADVIYMYSIHPSTGELTPLSPATVPAGSGPRFIKFAN